MREAGNRRVGMFAASFTELHHASELKRWREFGGPPSNATPNEIFGGPPPLGPKSDSMKDDLHFDAEEARQWALTFRLMAIAVVLAGLIIGLLAIRG
jgi:hypothetical protein